MVEGLAALLLPVATTMKAHAAQTGVAAIDKRIKGFVERFGGKISLEVDRNPFRELKTRVVLASGARTGSHLLAERLQRYGVDFKELFNSDRILRLCSNKGHDSLVSYCEFVVQKYSNAGIFGFKGGLGTIVPMLLTGELPEFAREWGWIRLKRNDLVKQAVSHSLARKAETFRSVRRGREVVDTEYDGSEILKMLLGHRRANEAWDGLFAAFSIEPCRVSYEELAADPDGVAAAIAERLGLRGPPARGLRPPGRLLQKQANTLNAAWEARFLEEHPEFRQGPEPGGS